MTKLHSFVQPTHGSILSSIVKKLIEENQNQFVNLINFPLLP